MLVDTSVTRATTPRSAVAPSPMAWTELATPLRIRADVGVDLRDPLVERRELLRRPTRQVDEWQGAIELGERLERRIDACPDRDPAITDLRESIGKARGPFRQARRHGDVAGGRRDLGQEGVEVGDAFLEPAGRRGDDRLAAADGLIDRVEDAVDLVGQPAPAEEDADREDEAQHQAEPSEDRDRGWSAARRAVGRHQLVPLLLGSYHVQGTAPGRRSTPVDLRPRRFVGALIVAWYHVQTEPVFGPVGMRGFDRAQIPGNASRGCCSGLVNQAAKRSTWQPPVDSRPRCLGSKVSVEATSASRVVEASCSGAAIRISVT